MTLSGSLKVLRKLLEPSLSFQLFGASTPEGRFSKDRQFTFFFSQFSNIRYIFHISISNMVLIKKIPWHVWSGENEYFGRGLMVILVLSAYCILRSFPLVLKMYPGDGNWVIMPLGCVCVDQSTTAVDEAAGSDCADTRFANQVHKDTNTNL